MNPIGKTLAYNIEMATFKFNNIGGLSINKNNKK